MKKLIIILLIILCFNGCDNNELQNEVNKGKIEHNYKTYFLKVNLDDGYLAIRENSSNGKIVDRLDVGKLVTRSQIENFVYEFKMKN